MLRSLKFFHPNRAFPRVPQEFLHSLKTTLFFAAIGLFALLQGCAQSSSYREQHELNSLTVIFLDEQALHQEWENLTGNRGIRFSPSIGGKSGMAGIKTVKGFYDFATNTIYCPKWDFEVCGHELHHAAVGHFHHRE